MVAPTLVSGVHPWCNTFAVASAGRVATSAASGDVSWVFAGGRYIFHLWSRRWYGKYYCCHYLHLMQRTLILKIILYQEHKNEIGFSYLISTVFQIKEVLGGS